MKTIQQAIEDEQHLHSSNSSNSNNKQQHIKQHDQAKMRSFSAYD
jgi:hypothetical protein